MRLLLTGILICFTSVSAFANETGQCEVLAEVTNVKRISRMNSLSKFPTREGVGLLDYEEVVSLQVTSVLKNNYGSVSDCRLADYQGELVATSILVDSSSTGKIKKGDTLTFVYTYSRGLYEFSTHWELKD